MRDRSRPSNELPQALRTPRSARIQAAAFAALLHLALLFALRERPVAAPDPPAALPPMRVSLLATPSIFEAPAPIEANSLPPELRLVLPEIRVQEKPSPIATARTPERAGGQTGAPAAAPVLRRRNGAEVACFPRGWLMQVSQAISLGLRYPASSRRRGERGTVYLRLSVARGGQVLDAQLLRGSGHPDLDFEADDVIRRIGRFAPVPARDCAGHDVIVVDQPVRFGG